MVMACNKLQLETQIIDAQQKLNSENYFQKVTPYVQQSCPYHIDDFIALIECLWLDVKKKKHLYKTGKIAC